MFDRPEISGFDERFSKDIESLSVDDEDSLLFLTWESKEHRRSGRAIET